MYSLGAYKRSERPQILDQWDAIKESNYWDPLSDMLDEGNRDGDDIDGASEALGGAGGVVVSPSHRDREGHGFESHWSPKQ